MRKLLSAAVVLVVLAGLAGADEVTARRYDKKALELLVANKVGKESVYKVTDSTKVTIVDKDGKPIEAKATLETLAQRVKAKADKGGLKVDITLDGDTVTEVKLRSAGAK
ncbi:MAG: hypothetical protein JWO38_5553 [Gemmataceae bacterium]|nr:hypothetical protein [Gemmataceae bacterium]